MAKILASIQERQFTDEQIRRLELSLRRHYAEYVSEAAVTVIWCVIPTGQCYTNGQLSRSSLVSMECDNSFPQERRVQLLQACERDWRAVTEQDSGQIMISLLERDLFEEALRASQQRLSTLGRWRFNGHMLSSLLMSKLRRGYLSFSPNV